MYCSSADLSGWFRLKNKSRETFYTIVSAKSAIFFLNLYLGREGCLAAASPFGSAPGYFLHHYLGRTTSLLPVRMYSCAHLGMRVSFYRNVVPSWTVIQNNLNCEIQAWMWGGDLKDFLDGSKWCGWIYVAQGRVLGRCVVNTMPNRSPHMRRMSWLFVRMAVYGELWSLGVGFVTGFLTNSRFISNTQDVTYRKIKTNVVIPKERIL